jgi:endonuclease/exonuclease/phosphatase family metal-dependent hydrolase
MQLIAATYNIHRCVGGDGQQEVGRIAAVLEEVDADLVGLQEVESRPGLGADGRQADHLARAAGMRAIPGPTVLRSDSQYGNALLTRFPVAAVRRHDISVPGREPRGILDVDLDLGAGILRAIVTHLGLRRWERRQQVARLMDILARLTLSGPLVVLGDFNEWLGWGSANLRVDRRLGRSPAPRTAPAAFPLLRLDRIWVRPAKALRELAVHRTAAARVASDHLPVVATLRWKG